MIDCLAEVDSHFRKLTSAIINPDIPMWPSVVDTRSGRCPDECETPQRVYRLIGAPRGSTLYWDQPLVSAAHLFYESTGDARHRQAADDYIRAFLNHCVNSSSGIFLWGNHAYYDLFDECVILFSSGYHELRPITPAWDLFWRLDPAATERYIREMARRHVYDPGSGGFNRHDDGRKGHAFIEAGGILVESLTWLYAKTGDDDLRQSAQRIAGYSFKHRNQSTGLMPNEPDQGRWDSRVSTSEIGLWAECMLRAGGYTNDETFIEMARQATLAWIKYAYDPETGRYRGQVDVRTGEQVVPDKPGYWPGAQADPWNISQWPNHDYPMELARACLSLYAFSGQEEFVEAVYRWGEIVFNQRPRHSEEWAYAENYGKGIGFLKQAGRQLSNADFLANADILAGEAVRCLYENGIFQGYPGSHRYESVDGVGCLLLALLTTGDDLDHVIRDE